MDAALACFADKGYAATTMSDIRERSSASTGSIYHLFESKEVIAGALYIEGIRSHQEHLLRAVAETSSAEEAIKSIVRSYVSWFTANEDMSRFLMHMRQAELLPPVKEALRDANRAFFAALRKKLESYVGKRGIKALPWQVLVTIVIAPVQEFARTWLAKRNRLPPREAAEIFADAAWDAVRARAR